MRDFAKSFKDSNAEMIGIGIAVLFLIGCACYALALVVGSFVHAASAESETRASIINTAVTQIANDNTEKTKRLDSVCQQVFKEDIQLYNRLSGCHAHGGTN